MGKCSMCHLQSCVPFGLFAPQFPHLASGGAASASTLACWEECQGEDGKEPEHRVRVPTLPSWSVLGSIYPQRYLNNLLSPPQQRLTEPTQTTPATLLHPLSDLEHSLFFGEWPEMPPHPTRCVSGVEGGHWPSTRT